MRAQVARILASQAFASAPMLRRFLQYLMEQFAPWIPAVDVAAVYNALGDTDSALQWLAQARRDRSLDSLFMADDPWLRNLRSNTRFVNLLAVARS